MNCKPGDLAIIVNAPPFNAHNIGRIVRVTKLAPPRVQAEWHCDTTAAWHYEGPRLKNSAGREVLYVNDCLLRPLRDSDPDSGDCAPVQLDLMLTA